MSRVFNHDLGIWEDIGGGKKQHLVYKKTEESYKKPTTKNWKIKKKVVKKNG